MNYKNNYVVMATDDGYKLAAIDALRGWAIFLVIVSHTAGSMHGLPWPIKKLTNMGWYGVQLFFIMSAFTLLMSWQRQADTSYGRKCLKFFIRRFFRIAPMYYAGAVLYFIIRPPGDRFSIEQLLINLLFINTWSPATMPTLDNSWQVVPGGWSIGVEFSFYILFPLLATLCSSLKNSMAFTIASIIFGGLTYFYGSIFYEEFYDSQAVDNFLFFWLPNQIFVFFLGFLLYFFVKKTRDQLETRNINSIKFILTGLFIFILISQTEINKNFSTTAPFIPKHYLVSMILFIFSFYLIVYKHGLFVNKLIIKLGQVSFSAYILHFAIIQIFHKTEILNYVGLQAIVWCFLLITIVFIATLLTSISTYTLIEKPFINLSRNITKKI